MVERSLQQIVKEELMESALDLIEYIVFVHKGYPHLFEEPEFMQKYRFAIGMANLLEKYELLSDESKDMVDYLRGIEF